MSNQDDSEDTESDLPGGARSTALWKAYNPSTPPPPPQTLQPPASARKAVNIREYRKGDCITNQSDDPNAFLVVQIGSVHIYMIDALGKKTQLIAVLQRGDVIVRQQPSPLNQFSIQYQAADSLVTVKIVSAETEPDVEILLRLSREAIKQLAVQHQHMMLRLAEHLHKEALARITPVAKAGVRKILPVTLLAAETQRLEEARAEADNVIFHLLGEKVTPAQRAIVQAVHEKMLPIWHQHRTPTATSTTDLETNITEPSLTLDLDIDLDGMDVPRRKEPVSVRVKHDSPPSTRPATPVARQAASASPAKTPAPPASSTQAISTRYSIIQGREREEGRDRDTMPSAVPTTTTQLRPPPPPVRVPPPPKPAMQAEELEEDAPCKTEVYSRRFFEANAPRAPE